jgi:class 3 adenylate cyclase/tetratricopeptide (TPR) repeat protein
VPTNTGDSRHERRHLTVMFCDVVGSTALSGRQDVEAYFSIVRAYYDAFEAVVDRHNGLIAQHQGDGIFIWFGYPESRDDDTVRAVRAGLDLILVSRRLSSSLERVAGEQLAVRMAVHAGEVLIASVDGEQMPIAFGHTANVAAKLQQSARPGTLVVSDAVRGLIGDSFELEALEPPRVAGGSVTVFEVVSERRAGSHVSSRWRTQLVGREPEQQLLNEAWARTEDGAAGAIVLVGERGIGKTRLASELALALEATKGNVLDCTCHELDAGSAYRPFRVLLSQAAGIELGDPPIVSAALVREHLINGLSMDERAAGILGGVVGLPADLAGPPADLDPVRLGQVTNELLVDWVRRVAASAPTLLLIDDVPNADPSSLAVLAQITMAPMPHLLALFTARSDSPLPGFLRGRGVNVVELRPLTDEPAALLVDAVDVELDDARRRQVLALGEGVPLYLEELARGAHQAAGQGLLPITLTQRLQVRLNEPRIDREIAGVLAVAGQQVDEELLAAVLGISIDELRRRLEGLLAADLVVRAGPTATSLGFRHGLIADAAYAALLETQRAHWHRRIAEAMQHQNRDGRLVDWSVVGRHLLRAGRPLDAYEAILASADQARRTGASTEAITEYTSALDIVRDVADPTVREVLEVRCRLQRGITAFSTRGFSADEAVEDFDRCAELCRTLGPRPEHVSALSGVYTYYLLQGALGRAREIVEDLQGWVETGHDHYRQSNNLGFGVLSFYEGDYHEALRLLTLASQLPSEVIEATYEQTWGLPFDALAVSLAQLAPVLWICGRPRAGLDAADRAIARAANLPFPEGPYSMAWAKSYVAWLYSLGGHHHAAARVAREVRDLGARHGFAFWESTGEIHLALSEYRINGRPDAWTSVSVHASIWELLRARVFLPYVLTAAAALRGDMGFPDEAIAGLEAAGTLTQETGVRFYEAERLRLLAGALPDERQGEAEGLRIQAAELARDQGAVVFELRAALDLARADRSDSIARLIAAVEKFPAGAGYPELNEARALLASTTTRA